MSIGEVELAVEPRRQGEGPRCGVLGPLGEERRSHRVVVLLGALGRLVDPAQPILGVVEVGRQRREHGRDTVARVASLFAGADRDGAHRDERLFG